MSWLVPPSSSTTASSIDSGAAADGEVLTADGLGGVAWEAVVASESNDLTAAVVWTDIPIANVPTGTTGSTVALGNHNHAGVYEPIDATILRDADVDTDIKTLALPANTTISAFGKTLVDDDNAAAARATLSVDTAGTDNSTDVTIAAGLDYATITGQEITLGSVDLATDITGNIPDGSVPATAVTQHVASIDHDSLLNFVADEHATPKNSIEVDTAQLQLVGDASSPGNDYFYGTNGSGVKGWYVFPAAGAEVNNLTSSVTWANVPDANITQSSVTQHQAALSITESQISDLAHTTALEGTAILSTGPVTNGYVLTANGAGAATWQAVGAPSEVNDLTAAVTWANIPIANVPTGTTGSTVALGNHNHAGVYEPVDSTILRDADVDTDIKTLSLPANTTITGFGATLVDDDSAATARATLGVDNAGTDNSTDVTIAAGKDYITIAGQVLTLGSVDLTTDVTGDLPVTEGGTGASTAAAARSNLGVDVAGTDNSTDVTLSGAGTYLSLVGQALTADVIDLTTDVTGVLPIANVATGTPNGSQFVRDDGTLATPSGAGDVSKVGTPADNQIGVWTGDGTIEGQTGFTWTGNLSAIRQDNDHCGFELGNAGGAANKLAYIDLHSGATWVGYDVRLLASGGTGVNGGGNLELVADTLTLNDVTVASNKYVTSDNFKTQSQADSGVSTGAQVKHHNGSWYDVGLNTLPSYRNTSITLGAEHAGARFVKSTSTARSITLGSGTDFPEGAVLNVWNRNASGNITVNDGAQVLYLMDSGTVTDVGASCTIGPGGMATIIKDVNGTPNEYIITGSEITA